LERLNWNRMNTYTVPSFDPEQYERMRMDSYNASSGNLTDYDCPKCRNRGNFLRLREDLSRYFVPCSCMKTRSALRRLAASGFQNIVREMTFDRFQTSEGWQQALKEGAMEFAREGSGWLLISGPSGIGKTHLCTAVCRERLLKGEDVHYMSWRGDSARLKARITEDPEREALLQRIKNVQVLYIDDLFKTGAGSDGQSRPSSADLNLAFEILNHRYINHLCTLLSTEKTVSQLLKIDTATASRIVERCGSHAYSVREGKNYRLRNLQRL